ncbi:MAG: SDR family NAD(P)-dependent oxidoreductase [Rhizobiales bacterium TMED83]|nr:oxidoreductase [Rhodobiaceae bacterium]RPF92652.1 MAG: SDR family NAD(P)-dependent oxidoreductase [Rhizobiales bacterium TMED83]
MTAQTAKPLCVWITGASLGIGAALSTELAARGFVVAATARNEKALAELADTAANIHAFAGDITDRSGMAALVDTIERDLGPIVMAVLNAGIYLPTNFPEFDADLFDRSFAVNLGGTVNCLAPLVPLMSGRGRGRIAIVSSVAGYGGLPTSAAYGATKAALFNLGESLAMDLAAHGVKVSMIAPGFVRTPATDVNTFPMPFIISADDAARRIANGLEKGQAHIAFPKRFSYLLRLINLLPRGLYTRLVGGATSRN